MSYARGMAEIPQLDANGNPVLRSFAFGESYCNEFDAECVDWMLRHQGAQMRAHGAKTPVYGDPDYDAYVESLSQAQVPWWQQLGYSTAAAAIAGAAAGAPAPGADYSNYVLKSPVVVAPPVAASPAAVLSPVLTEPPREISEPQAPGGYMDRATDFLKARATVGDYSVPWWAIAAGAGALLLMGRGR